MQIQPAGRCAIDRPVASAREVAMSANRIVHRATARRSVAYTLALIAGLVTTSAVVATPAEAQSSGQGFLFAEPRWTLAIRGGFAHASAGSDIFDFTSEHLTVDRSDFDGFAIGGDLAFAVKPRLDLVVGASYSGTRTGSEFRDFVGTDDLPIAQTTHFVRFPITLSAKAFLLPRGEPVGSLAWIPTRFAPYVGVGGGAMRYGFEQKGEFVDFQDLSIYYDELTSYGWTPTAHGLAGFDLALTPRLGLATEARYTWARGELQDDFIGFDRIDLSGFSVTMGLHVRF
jgi:hypothetical protein